MTVAELIKELQKMPEQDVEVWLAIPIDDDDSGEQNIYPIIYVQDYPTTRFPGSVQIKA
jgi:hypothetical protein